MDKKGIIKIIEAFFAVLIIAGALIFVYTSQIERPDKSANIQNIEKIILDKISYENNLREAVLYSYLYFDEPVPVGGENISKIGNYSLLNSTITDLLITSRILDNYDFMFQICNLEDICGLEHSAGSYTKYEIYANEKSVSSTLSTYGPRKIRLFIWRKG
jgi:hypothetical protein